MRERVIERDTDRRRERERDQHSDTQSRKCQKGITKKLCPSCADIRHVALLRISLALRIPWSSLKKSQLFVGPVCNRDLMMC